MYIIELNNKTPLHLQLYTQIKEEIITNLKVGDKLPSIRKVASLYNLSKTTVESAYSQLYAEGYIESRPKSGYYVSELYFNTFKKKKEPKSIEIIESFEYDFFPAQLHSDNFPLKLWKRIFNKVINKDVDFGSYPDGQGIYKLREEIAKYLQNSRGVCCSAKNIIITHGFIDSMELIAKLCKTRYRVFGTEIPGYHIAYKVFDSFGYKIEKIAVKKDGININELQKNPTQILYITPTHQYPTGATIPIANRQKIIKHISSIGGLIIEDDYDSELSYYNRPIPSLQGLDRDDCVVYLGTFAKALSPALRVGYMVAPSWFIKLYKDSYDSHFSSVSITTQLTLEVFMREGHWDRHIRKMRTLNKKKHNLMKKELLKNIGDSCKIVAEGAGLAILIVPTKQNFNWQKLKVIAQKKSIKIYLAKERSGGEFEAVRMGFGGFKIDDIPKAVKAFSKIWKESF